MDAPTVPTPTEAMAEASAQSDGDTLKAALLGLNRKDTAEEPTEPAPPKRVTRRATRRPSPQFAAVPAAKPDLSDYAFQEAVNSWRGMRNCLSRTTLRGVDKRGAMKVAFKIRGDGSVSNCEVVETSNSIAATIASCVEQSARRIRFPAFGGDEVEKQAKFVF